MHPAAVHGIGTLDRGIWSKHWSRLETASGLPATLLRGARKKLIARSIATLTERYFPTSGTFLHAGSGTAETDCLIVKHNRQIIAVDLVYEALLRARQQPNSDRCLVADIKELPFRDDSIDGIWNVGVHEHFSPDGNKLILRDYLRTLKSNGRIVILWPGAFSPYMLLKNGVELLLRLRDPRFRFFPDEINKARSKMGIRRQLQDAGFRVLSISLNWTDLFVFYAAVGEKP